MDSANNLQENPRKFSDGEIIEDSEYKVQAKSSKKMEQSAIENNTQTGAVFVQDNSKSDCISSIERIERSAIADENLAIYNQNNDQEAVLVSALQEINSYKNVDIPTKENPQMDGSSSDIQHENPSKPRNGELIESSVSDALGETAKKTEESATENNIRNDAGFEKDGSKCNCISSIGLIEKDTIEDKNPAMGNQSNDQEYDLVSVLQEEDGDLALDISANENLRMNHNENFINSLEENPGKPLNEEVIEGSEYEILAESSKKAEESTIEKNTQNDAVFEQDGSKSKSVSNIGPIEDANTAINEKDNLSCEIERNVGTSSDPCLEGNNFVVNNHMHFDKPANTSELLVENCVSKRVMQSNGKDDDNILKESIGESNSIPHMNTKAEGQCEIMHENDRMLQDAKHTQNKSEKNVEKVEDNPPKTLRIVLIGQTGVGKSSTGNTLLGERRFKSSPSSKSCTQVCQRETTAKQSFILEVLDTPGLFDTHKPADELRKEFLNCMIMTNPGPHAFLLILKMNRITEQEKQTLKSLKEIFGGDHFLRHTIIVITRKEDLADTYSKDEGKTDKSLDLLFKTTLEKSPDLFHMVSQCKNRYYLLSNKGKVDGISRSEQAIELISLINEMTLENGDTFYSYQYFVSLEEERKLQVRREQEKKEKKRRLQREMKQKEELAILREQELELKLEKARIEREEEQRRAKREKARLEAELREELLEKERLKRERERQERGRRVKELEAEVRRKERYRERWEILEERRSSSDNWRCIVM